MKLYELRKGEKIKVQAFNDKDELIGQFLTFDHIDGMYSYCTVDGMEGEDNVVHLKAWTPLKKVGDYYEIDLEANKDDMPEKREDSI